MMENLTNEQIGQEFKILWKNMPEILRGNRANKLINSLEKEKGGNKKR